MTTPNQQVRRATVEDLPQLVELWKQEDLPWPELEKRFKEFQVVEEADRIIGAVGLDIAGLEGRLHSEAFARPELADAAREQLWERAQIVAKNHGLVRLWTQLATPFWTHSGFQVASDETTGKLPPAFSGDPHPWRFMQLRDDAALPPSVEKEFAMFKEMEQAETQKIFRRARTMKMLAFLVVIVVFVLIGIWVFLWFRTQRQPLE